MENAGITRADYLREVLDEYEQFGYDKLDNRETVTLRDESVETYVVNSQTNRYYSVGGNSLTYDDAGNLTVNQDGYKLAYDYENRLIEVRDSGNDLVAEYTYDALGRRIEKKTYANGQPDETTRYYYNDNWQVLTEIEAVGQDETERSFIYGNYIDEAPAMIADDGQGEQIYYYARPLPAPVIIGRLGDFCLFRGSRD